MLDAKESGKGVSNTDHDPLSCASHAATFCSASTALRFLLLGLRVESHSAMIPPSLLLAPVLLSLFRHVSGAVMIQETKHGVIGLGIPMYKPVCCYACHDALSSLNLNCTTFSHGHMGMEGMDMKLIKRMDMGGDSMAQTTDECRASDPTWLATLAYCIHSRCTAEGADVDSQDRCFQTIAANTHPVPNLHSCMPAQPPTGELEQDAEWLNTTSLVNDAAYDDQRRTLDGFARSEEVHTRYG